MAFQQLFYNIIIPSSRLGGYNYLENIHPERIGRNVWYDQYLIRDGGSMGYADIDGFLSDYEARGLKISEMRNGKRVWADLCVVESGLGPVEYDCEWISYNANLNTVGLSGLDTRTILMDLDFNHSRKSSETIY